MVFLASIWLTCHTEECTLELTPPGSRTKRIVFSRKQLISAHAIKCDKAGNFISFDTSKYEPPSRKNKKGKKSQYSYKGPDENGEYRSYGLKFKISTAGDEEDGESDALHSLFARCVPVESRPRVLALRCSISLSLYQSQQGGRTRRPPWPEALG